MLSNKIQLIQPSQTLAINAKAIEMQKKGADLIKFGTGEPDFDTPLHIKNAAIKAIKEGFTKYTATSGILELKNAITEKFKNENNIFYKPENIICSNGAKQVLYNAFQVLLNPGDEVILGAPYWVSYVEMIRLAEGKEVIIVTTNNNFQLTAEAVAKKITKKTKVILLNSPANPTGAIIPLHELEKIVELAVKNKIYIISDEVYEYFAYDNNKVFSIASLEKDIFDLTITVNAVSKSYSMTGWRLGYAGGPKEIINLMSNLQDHSTSCPSSISQKAALAALKGPKDCVKKMVKEFEKRRDFVFAEINKIRGMQLKKPEGAFYAFIKVSDLYGGKIKNSFDFCEFLLEKAGVVLIPGGAFSEEGDPYVRMSFAAGVEDLREGVERIKKALK